MNRKILSLGLAALVFISMPAGAQDSRESTYNLQSATRDAANTATSKLFNSPSQSGSSGGAVPFNLNSAAATAGQDPFSLTPEQIRQQQIQNAERLEGELLTNRQQFEQRLAERRAQEQSFFGDATGEFGEFSGQGDPSLFPQGEQGEPAKKKKKRVYRGKGDGFEKPQRVFNSVR